MAPRQEAANRLVDMVVRRPVGHQPRAVAEVSCPATQELRLRNYFTLRRHLGGSYLDLLRFS